jgi:AraC family transcriptional regulator, regulatory protein of adaptative response / DNA-3-methyladenine glycosylase II
VVQRIEEGRCDERGTLEDVADNVELSTRLLRRVIRRELGVAPVQLMQTRRSAAARLREIDAREQQQQIAAAEGHRSAVILGRPGKRPALEALIDHPEAP